MRSIFYLLDVAPYGCEKVYGVLNIAAVSIKMEVTIGLYADGIYLALAGQDSMALGLPNLSDIIYAYPEIQIIAHEPSLAKRGLMNQDLIERGELVDEDIFVEQILAASCLILL